MKQWDYIPKTEDKFTYAGYEGTLTVNKVLDNNTMMCTGDRHHPGIEEKWYYNMPGLVHDWLPRKKCTILILNK